MKRIIIKCCLVIPTFLFIPSLIAQTTPSPPAKGKTGYFNLTAVSTIIGSPVDDSNNFVSSSQAESIIPSLTMVNGYWFNKYFSAGIGVGAEVFGYTIFPVFADFRYRLPKTDYQPYFALKGGYAFAKNGKAIFDNYYYNHEYSNTGGWMFSPEIGVYFSIAPKIDLAVGLGYRYQRLKSKLTEIVYNELYEGRTYNHRTTFDRLTFSVGIMLR